MIDCPSFASSLQETEFTFHCVWYIEPVYSTDSVAISQKANEIQFEFPTKMVGKMVVLNAMILKSLPNFVDPSSFLRDLWVRRSRARASLSLRPIRTFAGERNRMRGCTTRIPRAGN